MPFPQGEQTPAYPPKPFPQTVFGIMAASPAQQSFPGVLSRPIEEPLGDSPSFRQTSVEGDFAIVIKQRKNENVKNIVKRN